MKQVKTLRRPIVMYTITKSCDMECTYCYNDSGSGSQGPSSEDLIENTKKIAEVAGAINFTGGEPFLRPELPELLALSSSMGVDNIVTSNGHVFLGNGGRKVLDQIADHVYIMKIGVAGASPETNDYIRGDGNFDHAIRCLDIMADYPFITCMKAPIDKHNKHELEDFVLLALQHGVDQLVFGQLIEIGRASEYLRDLVMNPDEMQYVKDELLRLKQAYAGGVKVSRHCTLSGLCQEPGHFYSVTTDGGMSPCLMREDLAIGNVQTGDVRQLFNQVDDLRRYVKTHNSVRDLCEGLRREYVDIGGELISSPT
ncbi:MAG: radical SAM protein [Candidatus Woesearchaeota archaeon]